MTFGLFTIVVSWLAICCYDTADAGSIQPLYCEDHCSYVGRAKDAECTNRSLEVIPSPRGNCANAVTLEISSNSISDLRESSFTGFRQLKYLYLQRNRISTIAAGTFLPIKRSLILVNISDNLIVRLSDGTFVNMTKLRAIFIRHNHIAEINSNTFTGMLVLSKLDLQDNRLNALNTDIFRAMPRLTELNLRHNNILKIDISFVTHLGSLETILLKNNSIALVIGEVSVEQQALSSIDISQNDVTSFVCAILVNLTGLDNINLSSNPLLTLRECGEEDFPVLGLDQTQLKCDCRLRELATWLQKNPDSSSPVCSQPKRARGEQVRDFINNIECVDAMETTTQHSSFRTYSNLPDLNQEMPVTVQEVFTSEMEKKAWDDNLDDTITQQTEFLGMKDPLRVVLTLIIAFSLIASLLLVCVIKHYLTQSRERNHSPTKHTYSDTAPRITGNAADGGRIRHVYERAAVATSNVHRTAENGPCISCRQGSSAAMASHSIEESSVYFLTDFYNSTRHNHRTHTHCFGDGPQHSKGSYPGYDDNTEGEVTHISRCNHSNVPRNHHVCGNARFKRHHKCTHTYGFTDAPQHSKGSYPGYDDNTDGAVTHISRCNHSNAPRNHHVCGKARFKRRHQCTHTYGNNDGPQHHKNSHPGYDDKPQDPPTGVSRCQHSNAPRNQQHFGKAHFKREGQILRITFESPPVCNSTEHIPCSSLAAPTPPFRFIQSEVERETAIYIPHS